MDAAYRRKGCSSLGPAEVLGGIRITKKPHKRCLRKSGGGGAASHGGLAGSSGGHPGGTTGHVAHKLRHKRCTATVAPSGEFSVVITFPLG